MFQAADEQGPNAAPSVVLSHQLWRSVFNADPGVVGTAVQLDKVSVHGRRRGPAAVPRHGAICLAGLLDPHLEPFRAGFPAGPDAHSRDGARPVEARRDAPAGGGNLSTIAAQLAQEYPTTDSGMPLRLVRPGLYADTGDVIRGFLYSVTGLGSAGAGGGVRQSRQPVCRARGGSEPGAGVPRRLGRDPVAAGAATADRGDGGVADGRSWGIGDREPVAGCAEPVAVALWPAGGPCRCACLPRGSDLDPGQRAASSGWLRRGRCGGPARCRR